MQITPRSTYNLILLGLYWLTDGQDLVFARSYTVTSIMYALKEARVINDKQVKGALANQVLRNMVRNHLDLCQSTPRDQRHLNDTFPKQILNSRKHLVLQLALGRHFDSMRVLQRAGSNPGYRYCLTTAGRAWAESKEDSYLSVVNPQTFIDCWYESQQNATELMRKTRGQARRRIRHEFDLDEE